MFKKEKFKKLISDRLKVDDIDEFLLDIAWKNEISYVCQDTKTFNEFILRSIYVFLKYPWI